MSRGANPRGGQSDARSESLILATRCRFWNFLSVCGEATASSRSQAESKTSTYGVVAEMLVPNRRCRFEGDGSSQVEQIVEAEDVLGDKLQMAFLALPRSTDPWLDCVAGAESAPSPV